MTIAPNQLATAQDVLAAVGQRLARASNLADVPNKPAALANLGARGMATQDPAAVAITGGAIDGVAIGGTAPAYGAFAQVDMRGDFTSPPTGFFWSDDGAVVMRVNDRLLVGGAAANDAAKPNIDTDWLTDLVNWPVFNATAAITSSFGTIALTTGSQTLDLDPVAAGTTQTTIGVAAFAMANNPGTFPADYFAAYGFYGEARVYPGTVSDAFAAELEAINMSGLANAWPTPYRELQTGSAQALRLGSGGGQGLDVDPAISALAIVPNGSTFNAGIVFEKGALTGADGDTGFGDAILMAKGHLAAWYAEGDGNGERTFFVTSTISDADFKSSIQAQDGAILFIQPNDTVGFSVSTVASAVNGMGVKPSATGVPVQLEAFGADANVGLALSVKGTGALTAQVPTGGVAGGNSRGAYAVDWQTSRGNAAQVASGEGAVILGGSRNTASGDYTVAAGYNSNASGDYAVAMGNSVSALGIDSVALGRDQGVGGDSGVAIGANSVVDGDFSMVLGEYATDRGRDGALVWANGRRATRGDAQLLIGTALRGTTTDGATPVRLTSTGGSADPGNVVPVAENGAMRFDILVVAEQNGLYAKEWLVQGVIRRGATELDTVLPTPAGITSTYGDAELAAASVAVTADTTLGALNVSVTGVAGRTLRWNAWVAGVEAAG